MKKIIFVIALWACVMSVYAQAVPDTIYIYETKTVYDTIVIRDTIRIKRAPNMSVVQPKNIDTALKTAFSPSITTPLTGSYTVLTAPTDFFSPSAATFSENSIIYHENTNQKNVNIMNKMSKKMRKSWNYNLASYLSATILTAQSTCGMLAQEHNPTAKETLPLMPVQFSIVYPMTTMGDKTVDYRYSLSFNLFTGKVGAVRGVEFGTIYNHVEQNVWGVQFSGIGNRAREINGVQFASFSNTSTSVKGIQFGGLLNVGGGVHGIQFGGISNFSDSIRGIQFAGVTNHCKEVNGMQFSGIANVAENVKGMQIGGIVNLSEKSDGIQIAGIANISREVSGVSVGGIYNRTGTLRGVQIGGIVNVIDTIESGISISLLNIVRKGAYKEWSLTCADYMNVGLSFKIGIPKFYAILTAGANFMEDNLWVTGFGFGHRTPLGSRFDFQPEIVGYQYYPIDFRNYQNALSTHLKFGFIYKLSNKFGISVAPSIFYFNTETGRTNPYNISPISPFFKFETKEKIFYINEEYRINRMLHSFGAGISIGLLMN